MKKETRMLRENTVRHRESTSKEASREQIIFHKESTYKFYSVYFREAWRRIAYRKYS
ncbi:MAG: hypothetical protein IJW19_02625 [Clostridia bacterium]|nr:hypothetical protein [Clostridia bacterium]